MTTVKVLQYFVGDWIDTDGGNRTGFAFIPDMVLTMQFDAETLATYVGQGKLEVIA